MTMDPLAEKDYSASPYAYCRNNPIRYVDPTGMEFTDRAEDEIVMLTNKYAKDFYDNSVKIYALRGEISGGGLSDKQINSKEKEISKLEGANNQINIVRKEISTLAASNQVYDIYMDNSMNISGVVSGTGENRSMEVFNFTNGNFDIKLGDSSLGMLVHELKHAYQFETGAYSTGYMTNGAPFYDQSDEVEAYARGAFFGGQSRSASSIASDSTYSKLPVGPINATNHPNIMHLLNNPAALQKMVNGYQQNGMAFRINGITYRTIYNGK